ncbi:MAG: acetoin:2,6-dichlorophenolindophenol oxidoreductase subunit alpha [Desulfobacteraceae bacterium Eth-SRB1]|nr:MAG: acetoin:2,6-dichlorophenolindophenol oxidoreductase subunit alpha [Desulfobacteraceae bacterium Eth-SRB1]
MFLKSIINEDDCKKRTAMTNIELNKELYKKIYLMRKAEEKIQEVYYTDVMKTPVHLSLGEEAIVAGVCQALSVDDQVYGTCRGHALYLARSKNLGAFYGELCGKVTGVAKGKAGSMHISCPESGFVASSAIVSSTIPVALGAAFAAKYKKSNHIVAVFFGDGATEEGVFWETLNMACLKKLPILFVCEDNGMAIHAQIKDRQNYSIPEATRSFGLSVHSDDTTDSERIYSITEQAVQDIKKTDVPHLLHLKYHRYLEHVGVNEDYSAGYRGQKDDYADWYARDPVLFQREKLKLLGIIGDEIKLMETEIDQAINESTKLALDAPFPADSELFKDVYA